MPTDHLPSSDEVDRALSLIVSDPGILGGVPVFKGSRVPIEIVLASLDAGVPFSRLKESYPILTDELVWAARLYARIKPQHGRPRPLSEPLPSGWAVKRIKVIGPG
jgi:uncharacterized protein (DUF433 family)